MKTAPSLFIFSGEPSGDLHGSFLIHALHQLNPHIKITGVGGPLMRAKGMESLLKMEQFSMMGLSDVLHSLPTLWKNFTRVRNHILNTRPAAVILIDYPGFNLRMAKSLRKHGFKGKLVQYIAPTVWAWGKERIDVMVNTLNLLLTILPFEAAYFQKSSLPVKYVGHPIVEVIKRHHYDTHWKQNIGIGDSKNMIALFPGSRESEIKKNLSQQLAAMSLFKKTHPTICFGLSISTPEHYPLILTHIKKSDLVLHQDLFLVPKRYTYELMRDCHSAIAKSGTVTLELALHHKPTVVTYQLSALNRLFAKYYMRLNLPHYCLVNILNQKTTFPELIADGFTSESLYQNLKSLYPDGPSRQASLEGCSQLQHLLKEDNASQKAAYLILELLS